MATTITIHKTDTLFKEAARLLNERGGVRMELRGGRSLVVERTDDEAFTVTELVGYTIDGQATVTGATMAARLLASYAGEVARVLPMLNER